MEKYFEPDTAKCEQIKIDKYLFGNNDFYHYQKDFSNYYMQKKNPA